MGNNIILYHLPVTFKVYELAQQCLNLRIGEGEPVKHAQRVHHTCVACNRRGSLSSNLKMAKYYLANVFIIMV